MRCALGSAASVATGSTGIELCGSSCCSCLLLRTVSLQFRTLYTGLATDRAIVKQKRSEVALYAQEPAFTSLDHEFLSLLSLNVCIDDIATHITPRSFVFSPFVDWYMLLPIFLKGKDPVLYVGNEILDDYGAFAQSDEKRAKLEGCNELGKRWLERRDMVKLAEFEMHPHALNGMVVYWIEQEEKIEGTGPVVEEKGDTDVKDNEETKAIATKGRVSDGAGDGTGEAAESKTTQP